MNPKSILTIDIGGTHVKFRTSAQRETCKIVSGPHMTPKAMVKAITAASGGWQYDRVSLGYPGPVILGKPLREPFNLGKGWMKFDWQKAFGGRPCRMINDAAMQALGSYKGGRMLFLGLGTGLGSAMVVDGVVEPMELAHLPWRKGKTYEDFLGLRGIEKDGKKAWRKNVLRAIAELSQALESEYVVLGGGNAKLLKALPKHVVLGGNENAMLGGFALWRDSGDQIARQAKKSVPLKAR